MRRMLTRGRQGTREMEKAMGNYGQRSRGLQRTGQSLRDSTQDTDTTGRKGSSQEELKGTSEEYNNAYDAYVMSCICHMSGCI